MCGVANRIDFHAIQPHRHSARRAVDPRSRNNMGGPLEFEVKLTNEPPQSSAASCGGRRSTVELQLPTDHLPARECVAGQRKMARVSRTPGSTTRANDSIDRLVDRSTPPPQPPLVLPCGNTIDWPIIRRAHMVDIRSRSDLHSADNHPTHPEQEASVIQLIQPELGLPLRGSIDRFQ